MRTGRRLRSRVLDVRRLDSRAGHVRVAIVVPRLGHTAVDRNRLKRRLRELVRHHVLPAPCSCDVLLRARRDTYDTPFEALRSAVAGIGVEVCRHATPPDSNDDS